MHPQSEQTSILSLEPQPCALETAKSPGPGTSPPTGQMAQHTDPLKVLCWTPWSTAHGLSWVSPTPGLHGDLTG